MAFCSKILIANRGEIACRIIATAKKLGLKTVAVFSQADATALHVRLADEAYLIGPSPPKKSYLNIKQIIAIAKQADAKVIHPGYGFLSENPLFAKACEQENLLYVGPSHETISLMANKNMAKEIMRAHGIPVLADYYDEEQSNERLLKKASEIGFPVVLKAVAGGGGKGLRLVDSIDEFNHALLAVKREAKAFFDDERILVEKYLSNTRHIEVQILADHFNTIHALYTRDCSIQRRHQKIIEEAPAPNISINLQKEITSAAIAIAKTIQYTNAGTIEFLVQQDAFYFLEMNTRLQVEHPVTEMITGIDIVEWQLKIAFGERLFAEQPPCRGHSIEVRLNSEDPEKDFLPSSGELQYFKLPTTSSRVRIDCGYQQGDYLNIYYDSLIAKIIVRSENRLQALRLLQEQLDKTEIFGIKTNLPLLKSIITDAQFIQSQFNTHFLQHITISTPLKTYLTYCLGAVFLICYQQQPSNLSSVITDRHSPWKKHDGWQLFFHPSFSFQFMPNHCIVSLQQHNDHYQIHIADQSFTCQILTFQLLQQSLYQLELLIDGQHHTTKIFKVGEKLEILFQNQYFSLEVANNNLGQIENQEEEQLIAPMPGTLVALMVNTGQKVIKGDKLLVIEAMKMEHTLYAPRDGIVKSCHYRVGDLIEEGAELLEFESIGMR